ncbi:MAG: ribosome maturation factor RimM [Acidobacteriia bacterium]|nr:ribosome maturation factor RimM [Terriglobia bacterium]
MSPETSGEFITVARAVKTQGRHGEVAAEVHSDVPERFAQGMRLFALQPDGTRRELDVEELWPHKNFLVLKFAGVDSISDAEPLVRCELQVPRSQRASLEPGWSYVSDLAGCTVLDHGREIGHIEDVQFGAGEAPLLIVSDGTGTRFDVPFAEAYLEGVDLAQKRVRMSLPEGMLDINAPVTQEERQEQASQPHKKGAGRRRKQK